MLFSTENNIGSECGNGPSGLESLTILEETLLYKFLISVYYFLCFQETLNYLLQQNYKLHGYVPAKNTMKSTNTHPNANQTPNQC
jgi:hypothetical protein